MSELYLAFKITYVFIGSCVMIDHCLRKYYKLPTYLGIKVDKIILYLALGGFIYLGSVRLFNYLILLFLNRKEDSLSAGASKIKEEIRDLNKQLEDNKRPIVPDLTPDEVKKHWNPDNE